MNDTSLAITKFSDLANPTRFLALASRLLPWMSVITALLIAVGLYLSFTTDGDYQQGNTVRIMYVHVPAAWLAMMCYTVMAASAIGTLVWRHPLADVSHKAAAPLGAAFTLIALITGSLWGKPMWGTWWVWDARLTSVFILFLMYLGLIAFNKAMDDPSRAARVSAVLILVGFVNIPIIKFSVEWWNTLHQPASVIRMDGPAIDPEFLWPLLIMALGFSMLFFTLHIAAMRNEILRRRIAAQRRLAARMANREA
ncbi:heme ABC transporter permease [Rhizobium sp. CG4]|jgi:heme exporter protein C|uniref:heme ABC transporter permease n=1 Tax=Rhizobium/Agrobacterium group TaxID=227290 RepID=UPI00203371CB|nr:MULTISPECIES: heme ABC transporter permease [Rhizobium/Agrobacterium group]MCM2456980.1 heme ABC transporter permease [Rhizobium sp. CG4]MDO5893839.1 heme ABC transporter permease [Agrobacterium sp. Azo12]